MKGFIRFLQLATLLSALSFIGSVLLQIYARFFMSSAPSWTEEASRFFFIYAMSFAAGLALKDGEYVFLDIVYTKLSVAKKKLIDIAVPTLVTVLFLILGIYSLSFIHLGIDEKSSSVGFSMALSFTSIFIMAVSVSVFSVQELIKCLRDKE